MGGTQVAMANRSGGCRWREMEEPVCRETSKFLRLGSKLAACRLDCLACSRIISTTELVRRRFESTTLQSES